MTLGIKAKILFGFFSAMSTLESMVYSSLYDILSFKKFHRKTLLFQSEGTCIYYAFSHTYTFHLQEAMWGISLAYPNCQLHYFWALGPLLSKTRWLEHKNCDTMTVNLITEAAIKRVKGRSDCSVGTLDKGWFMSWTRRTGLMRLHHATQNGAQVKLMNCLFL